MSLFARTPLPEYAPDVRKARMNSDDLHRRNEIAAELGERVDVNRDLGAEMLIRRVRAQRETVGRGDRDGLLDVAGYCQALVERMDRSDADA